jgi:hypothetical protein
MLDGLDYVVVWDFQGGRQLKKDLMGIEGFWGRMTIRN